MEFNWDNTPFEPNNFLSRKDIEESFEDPFAVRLMPDSPRFGAKARYFNLGVSAGGSGVFSVYHTNGKQIRVLYARHFQPEEKFFYERKMERNLSR
jgi:hypothetical protein